MNAETAMEARKQANLPTCFYVLVGLQQQNHAGQIRPHMGPIM